MSSTQIGFKKSKEENNKQSLQNNFTDGDNEIRLKLAPNIGIDDLASFLKKKQHVKKDRMRRLRCKVMKLTDKILSFSCGHLKYMSTRGMLIDLRMFTKNENLKNYIHNLTQEGRRQFDTLKKKDYDRVQNLNDTKGLDQPKLNLVTELSEFLTQEEIDEISDDPFYYFSNSKGKPLHQELLNVGDWNKSAGLIAPTQLETNMNIYKFVSNGLRVLKTPETNLENFYLKSRNYEQPIRLKWHNDSEDNLSYFWTNKERQHKLMVELNPGQGIEFHTYAGHPWTVRTEEGVIAYYNPLKNCKRNNLLEITTDVRLESTFVEREIKRNVHEFNDIHAYEKNQKNLNLKHNHYRIKNYRTRQVFEKNFEEEMSAQVFRNGVFRAEIQNKEKKADIIIKKYKESIEYHKKEKMEEEKRKMYKLQGNLQQLKEIEEMNVLNEQIKNNCKQLLIKKNMTAKEKK